MKQPVHIILETTLESLEKYLEVVFYTLATRNCRMVVVFLRSVNSTFHGNFAKELQFVMVMSDNIKTKNQLQLLHNPVRV